MQGWPSKRVEKKHSHQGAKARSCLKMRSVFFEMLGVFETLWQKNLRIQFKLKRSAAGQGNISDDVISEAISMGGGNDTRRERAG